MHAHRRGCLDDLALSIPGGVSAPRPMQGVAGSLVRLRIRAMPCVVTARSRRNAPADTRESRGALQHPSTAVTVVVRVSSSRGEREKREKTNLIMSSGMLRARNTLCAWASPHVHVLHGSRDECTLQSMCAGVLTHVVFYRAGAMISASPVDVWRSHGTIRMRATRASEGVTSSMRARQGGARRTRGSEKDARGRESEDGRDVRRGRARRGLGDARDRRGYTGRPSRVDRDDVRATGRVRVDGG